MAPLAESGRPPLHPGSPSSSYDPVGLPPLSPLSLSSTSRIKTHLITPISEAGVRFFPFTQIIAIPSTDSYTDKETRDCWYSDKYIEQLQKEGVEVATRLGRKNLRRGESGRGLEQLTPRGYQETTSSRMNSTFAVLSEQYRQDQLLSIRDESKLAEVYATTSQMATIRAQDKAAVDALDAQYHQTEDPYMDDECDDTSFDCWFMSPAKWLIPFGKARVAPV